MSTSKKTNIQAIASDLKKLLKQDKIDGAIAYLDQFINKKHDSTSKSG